MSEPSPPKRNIELKAYDPDPEDTQSRCRGIGATDEGVIWQRDTYFDVARGRMKLREQTPGATELIVYDRADTPEERESRYHVIGVGSEGEALREALKEALGFYVVVEKHRHLFLWQGVRIHLDEVEVLGRFVEIEAVAEPQSDLTRERELVASLRAELKITDDRLCARGYADQLLASK